MKTKLILASLTSVPVLFFSTAALANSTWNLYTSCTGGTGGCSPSASVAAGSTATFSNTTTTSDPAITMTAKGWSTGINNSTAGTTFAASRLQNYSSNGWGVLAGAYSTGETDATGPHSVDNVYGTDLIALSFGTQQVALNSVKIGWNGDDNATGAYVDSDISVLRYTGAVSPAPVSGLTVSQLLTNGWELVGNFNDVGSATNPSNTASFNATNTKTSSWWLISAYNSAYGGPANGADNGNDAFKLLQVAGTLVNTPPPPGVPEPASAALLGLGFLGMVAARRKSRTVAH